MSFSVAKPDLKKQLFRAIGDFTRYQGSGAFSDLVKMLVCECTPHWWEEDSEGVSRPKSLYTEVYLDRIRGYEKDHIRKYYLPVKEALVAYYMEHVTPSGGWCDPLGNYLEEEVGSKKGKQWMGQFFTPEHICDFMSLLTIGKDRIETKDSLNILDPACGSGRCLLSFDRSCPPSSFNFYVGMDLDPLVIDISALNFYFHGIRGGLIHANTLSMEVYGGYRVWAPETGIGIEHISKAQAQRYLYRPKLIETKEEKVIEKPIDPPVTKKTITHDGKQLTLF